MCSLYQGWGKSPILYSWVGAATDVNSQSTPFSQAPRKLEKLYHSPSWSLRFQSSLQQVSPLETLLPQRGREEDGA